MPGDYIFDITGHITFVTVLGTGVVKGTPIADGRTVFKPESDGKNYDKDKEWAQRVRAIWKK